jgi:hypothetical protein
MEEGALVSDDGDVARQEALRRRNITVDMVVPVEHLASVTETAEAAAEADATVERFVSIDHTSPAFKETDEALARLEDAVRGSNDLFANPDERLAVISEVQGVRQVIRGKAVRVAAVISAITNNGVIAFLATEFARATIRELATKAIKLLWTLIQSGP